jgi:hypothetical protein
MYVYVESDPLDGELLREVVRRRARTATRRLSYVVSQAKVKFTQVFKSGGASDQQCRVEFTVDDSATIVATARAADWRDALDGALRRAAAALLGIHRRSQRRARQMRLAVSSNDAQTKPSSDAGHQRQVSDPEGSGLHWD